MDVCIDFLWKEPDSIAISSPACKAACERFGNNLLAEKTKLNRFRRHQPSIGQDIGVSSGILRHFAYWLLMYVAGRAGNCLVSLLSLLPLVENAISLTHTES